MEDPAVQSSARLLWDRVATLHEGVGEEQAALIAGARAAEDIPALLQREQFLFGYDALSPRPKGGPSPFISPDTTQLTVIGNQYYVRDGQPVLPIMCHYMEAFSRYTRNENQVTNELTAIKEAGYTGIRFLDVLNGQPYWAGREVNPINVISNGVSVNKTTQYYTKLKNFVSLCKDLGLLVNWSRGDLIPYSIAQRAEHFAHVGAIANEVGVDAIAVFEGVNEYFENGFNETAASLEGISSLVNVFSSQAGTTMLRALSSPRTAEMLGTLASHTQGVSIAMAHGARGGDLSLKLNAIKSIRRDYWPGKLVWQDEPPGTTSSATTNQHEMDDQGLALMAVQSLLHDQAYTVMLKNAVRWNDTLADDVGFRTVPAAIAQLPNDLMQWPITKAWERPGEPVEFIATTGFPGNPASPAPYIDQRINLSQGKIAAVMYGTSSSNPGGTRIRSTNRRWVGSAYKFTNDSPYVEEFDTFDLEKDEEQTLDYDQGAVRGCLLLGEIGE